MVLETFISHVKQIMGTRILWRSLSCQIFYSISETLNISTSYFSSKFPMEMAMAEHNQAASMLRQTPDSHHYHGGSMPCQTVKFVSQSTIATDFLLSTSIFPCQYHSTMASHSFIHHQHYIISAVDNIFH